MTARVILALATAAAVGGCSILDDVKDPPTPQVAVFSARPLDAIAYRDGDDPWKVPEHRNGLYAFEIRKQRYTLALVCRSLGLAEVIHALSFEVEAIHVPCGDPLAGHAVPETTHRWQGAIRGVGPGAQVTVSFGVHQVPFPGTVTGPGYTADLRPGAHDLLAVAEEADGRTRVIVQHHVEVTGPGTLDLDFGSVDALVPRLTTISLPSVPPSERLQTGVLVTTWRGARGALLSTMPGQVPLLAASQLSPDDIQEVWLRSAATDAIQLRGTSQNLGSPSRVTLNLPAPITGTTAMLAATTPVARPRVTFHPQPEALFYQLTVAQLVPQETITWVINAGAGWLATGDSLELPDLSGVPGFSPELGPPPKVPLQLELTVVTSNRPMGVLLDGVAPPGPGESTAFAKTVLTLQ